MIGNSSRKPYVSPHWSKDFVEHIRTVNFALIAGCLALIGILQFDKPKDWETAEYQLKEIRELVGDAQKNLSVQLPEPITADELEISGLHFNILLTPSVVVSGDKKGNEKLVPGASAATQLMPQLRTLADFPTIWEMLDRKLQIVHACISSRWASLRCGGRLARRDPGSEREEHALSRHRTS